MASSNYANSKPVEYFIGRATDPFLDAEQRTHAILALCEKVNTEVEAAQISVNNLGHRLLSPNQEEALYVLQTVEALMQKCGAKVHTKVGKYRFLNQMVKLVSYKHNGALTSQTVREKATVLLFTWQKQMRHIEKFKEVYDNLRDHNVIAADPIVQEDEIPAIPPPAPKLAPFEDEQKAEMLKQLLSSTNPDDLQAANRLIKSLVRTEDIKLEKVAKRHDDMERARRACECMEHLLFQSQENLGLATGTVRGSEIKAVYDSLLNTRPILFKYASEAAESEEEVLEDILALNDQVNKLIGRYQTLFEGRKTTVTGGGEERDLLGGELTLEQEIASMDRMVPTTSTHLCDDVPFIGSETFGSTTNHSDVLSDLSSLLGASQLISPMPSSSREFTPVQSESIYLPGSLEEASVSLEDIQCAMGGSATDVLNSGYLRIVSHNINSPLFGVNVCPVLLSVYNLAAHTISNIRISVTAKDTSVVYQLIPASGHNLPGFTLSSLHLIHYVLLISLKSGPRMDFDLSLSLSSTVPPYTNHLEASFSVRP